jgi:hypothetical protein
VGIFKRGSHVLLRPNRQSEEYSHKWGAYKNISEPKRSNRRVAHDDSNTESLKALSDSSYDSDLVASSNSDRDFSNSEYDPDAEIFDEDDIL